MLEIGLPSFTTSLLALASFPVAMSKRKEKMLPLSSQAHRILPGASNEREREHSTGEFTGASFHFLPSGDVHHLQVVFTVANHSQVVVHGLKSAAQQLTALWVGHLSDAASVLEPFSVFQMCRV